MTSSLIVFAQAAHTACVLNCSKRDRLLLGETNLPFIAKNDLILLDLNGASVAQVSGRVGKSARSAADFDALDLTCHAQPENRRRETRCLGRIDSFSLDSFARTEWNG
jgi:hypothetical protein